MKAMKAAKGAMKAMKAKGVKKTKMKAKEKRAAMGVRGEKNANFLNFFAAYRAPFWYGKSKVNTEITSSSHGRWRVYKNSPRDKVEFCFGFFPTVSCRKKNGRKS